MHAVWSRIVVDQEKIKAVQMSHDRLKLRTVAREFAREKGLELPDGLKKVMDLPEKLDVLPNDLALLRQFISSRLAL